jgi:thioredoxin
VAACKGSDRLEARQPRGGPFGGQEGLVGHIPTINNEDFEGTVIRSPEPVVVDFYATWCGPCRLVTPILEELSDRFKKVRFYKVDIDESPEIAERYAVAGVPTLVMIKQGDEVDRKIGAHPKPALEGWLTQYAGKE